MSVTNDNFSDLERNRLQLEENIRKLQDALQHWQTWDAEYEALKEEVESAPGASEAELARIQDQFEGELVNRREIDDILGRKGSRSKDQIRNILERRIDYVTKNIESLQKQIGTAEGKQSDAADQLDVVDEEGQPLTEIIEQLDDNDNVVSYRLNRQGDSVSQVTEALEKSGVKDAVEEDLPKEQPEAKHLPEVEAESKDQPSQRHIAPSPSTKQPAKEPPKAAPTVKKGVSFAEDVKPDDGPKPQVSRNAQRVEHIMQNAKEQEKLVQKPALPEDEDEDDAEIRRQMLQYSMGEVGAVVAELEIDEGDTDDDDYEFDYSDEGFEDDDDDDRYGRYTGRVVTDDYAQRMLELEKKLGIRSRFTREAEPDKDGDAEDPSKSDEEGIGRIVVNRSEAANMPSTSKPPAQPSAMKRTPTKSNINERQTSDANEKKGVRFAESLDIAPVDERASIPATDPAPKGKENVVEPLSDIVERSGPTKSVETKSTRKPSRFKKTIRETPPNQSIPPGPLDVPVHFLDQDRPTAPTGPEGTTIADTLVERERPAVPTAPDEFDDDMIQDAVADEYHRMRKKFIQRDGGFLKEDENPRQPLDESEGGRERVSRFKSARLSQQ
ncbi:Fc.00g021040.m01.CDS01 [Cosmosporella sp. VM-42]